jgi:uncharacterized membrane protein HdeD (DUF308 family)
MAILESNDVQDLGTAVGGTIRRHWVLFLIEGIVLMALGMGALAIPLLASIAATIVFGWVLLLSGIIGLMTTFRARHAPGFGWSLVSAAVGIIAGCLLLASPLQGAFSLTAVIIAFLFVEGIVSILYALEHRRQVSASWGWMLVSGVVDLVLGGILLAGLPGTAAWALGVLVGINMIFGGSALTAMAVAARSQTRSG